MKHFLKKKSIPHGIQVYNVKLQVQGGHICTIRAHPVKLQVMKI